MTHRIKKCIIKINCLPPSKCALLIVLVSVLCTVFVTNSSFPQSAVTAKHFWFAAAVCFASHIEGVGEVGEDSLVGNSKIDFRVIK